MPGSSQDRFQGDQLGRFRLIAELGSGGMADVYLVVAQGPGGFTKLLVLKRLRSHDDPEAVTMFMDEARLTARLDHPNVVQTFEACQEANYSFIVMEYLEGITLQRLRKRTRSQGIAVPFKLELYILSKSLAGLHYAHEMRDVNGQPLNIVHRDFTPQNLFITYNGECKVLDFGIAKAADSLSQTQAGMYKGKVSYMAPEQLAGQAADRRADVFAAGVLLWEAAASRPMWNGLSSVAIFDALSRGELPKLREVNPTIPDEYVALVERALSPDLDHRFSTALELQQAVDHFRKAQGMVATSEELSQYVSYLFLEERKRQNATIQARLKSVSVLPTGDSIGVGMPNINAETESGGTPSPVRPAAASGRSEELTAFYGPPRVTAEPIPLDRPRPKRRVGRALLGTGLLVAAAVGGGVALMRFRASNGALDRRSAAAWLRLPWGRRATESSAPVPSRVPTPSLAESPLDAGITSPEAIAVTSPQPRDVTIKVSVQPASAKVFLDGVELPSNPFEGDFTPDQHLHVVRAEAPGFLPLNMGLKFDRDQDAGFVMQREHLERVEHSRRHRRGKGLADGSP